MANKAIESAPVVARLAKEMRFSSLHIASVTCQLNDCFGVAAKTAFSLNPTPPITYTSETQ